MIVPVVPVIVPPEPSPRAKDLGAKIAELIRIYCEKSPDIDMTEVRQAMTVAQGLVRKEVRGGGVTTAFTIGLLVSLLLGAAALSFFLWRPAMTSAPFIIMAATGLILVIGLAALAAARRGG
jgi:hypothetical protein